MVKQLTLKYIFEQKSWHKFYDQLYFINKTYLQNMQKASQRIVFYDKQNDFKKGNKNQQIDFTLLYKSNNHQKLYQSLSNSIQLRPNFLRRKPLTNTGQFCSLYGEKILHDDKNSQISDRFLAKHDIDSFLRAKMIDWMIEVTASYKFAHKTYFDGVQLMDRYFHAEQENLQPHKLHIIGVECMFIASKMNEVFPLRIKTVYQKIGHRKLAMDDLVGMEEKIVKQLDYKLNSWTFFDLAMLKLSQYYAFQEQERQAMRQLFPLQKQSKPNSEQRLLKMQELCSVICKFVAFEYDFLCQNSFAIIAQSCVKVVLEIMGAISTPSCFYSSSSTNLNINKQKIYKIIKNFKSNYSGLNNLFKYSPKELIEQVIGFKSN